jgi:hypothetical protein
MAYTDLKIYLVIIISKNLRVGDANQSYPFQKRRNTGNYLNWFRYTWAVLEIQANSADLYYKA